MSMTRYEIDRYLRLNGYYRKTIPKDDNNLFRAVAEQVYLSQANHENLRKLCVKYARENFSKFHHLVDNFEDYLLKLSNHLVVCGQTEMHIMSHLFRKDFIVFNTSQVEENVTKNLFPDNIFLCQLYDSFDSVYLVNRIDASCICQSILYEMVYKDVFHIENPVNIAIKMFINDDIVYKDRLCNEIFENDEEVESENSQSFPAPIYMNYRVAKSLHPNIYRNVAHDVWIEFRKEIRYKNWYFGDDNLKIGTKCLLTTGNETLYCHIQEFIDNNEKCVVFIEGTGIKKIVEYKDLKKLPFAEPWPIPGEKGRKSGKYRIDKISGNTNINFKQSSSSDQQNKIEHIVKNKQKYSTFNEMYTLGSHTDVGEGPDNGIKNPRPQYLPMLISPIRYPANSQNLISTNGPFQNCVDTTTNNLEETQYSMYPPQFTNFYNQSVMSMESKFYAKHTWDNFNENNSYRNDNANEENCFVVPSPQHIMPPVPYVPNVYPSPTHSPIMFYPTLIPTLICSSPSPPPQYSIPVPLPLFNVPPNLPYQNSLQE